MPDRAEEEVQRADETLSDADMMRGVGVTDEAVVNRLYYACFHAAQAVLYTRGVEPTTHQAVVSLFGKEVVLEGDATPEDGRLLNDLRDLRLQADYRLEPVEADVDDLYERIEEFIADMEALV